ncbi:MAG: peptidoglycan DD-metalloendopeptidase family protein [Oscillospiraceae bacterium]
MLTRKSDDGLAETQEPVKKSGKKSKLPIKNKPLSFYDYKTGFYRFIYYIGIQVIRSIRRVKKRIKKAVMRAVWFIKNHKHTLEESAHRNYKRIVRTVMIPVHMYKEAYIQFRDNVDRYDRKVTPGYWKIWGATFKQTILPVISHFAEDIFNIVAPIVAFFILIGTIQHYVSMNYIISVEYNNVHMGYIQNEAVFEQAQQEVKKRIIHDGETEAAQFIPVFTFEKKDKRPLTDVYTLSDRIIASSVNDLLEADGLYVDNSLVGAVENGNEIIDLLKRIKLQASSGAENEQVAFVKDIKLVSGLYPVNSITDVAAIEQKLTSQVNAKRTYVVQDGDSAWLIADKTDTKLEALMELNPGIDESLLVGKELLIEQAEPFLSTKVIRTETYKEDIPFSVVKTQDSSRLIGNDKITIQGKNGQREITEQITLINGLETERLPVSTNIISEPVAQHITVGTMKPIQYVSQATGGQVGNFINPLPGSYISCGFWGYNNHTGIDLVYSGGRTYGSPVVASAGGTVEAAGWGGAYGYQVIINHGGGIKTRYAHNSSLNVVPGQHVNQGQTIAAAGRTGRVTGPHVHFEVIVNGSYKNPVNYLG